MPSNIRYSGLFCFHSTLYFDFVGWKCWDTAEGYVAHCINFMGCRDGIKRGKLITMAVIFSFILLSLAFLHRFFCLKTFDKNFSIFYRSFDIFPMLNRLHSLVGIKYANTYSYFVFQFHSLLPLIIFIVL